jgi:hypothetical protein
MSSTNAVMTASGARITSPTRRTVATVSARATRSGSNPRAEASAAIPCARLASLAGVESASAHAAPGIHTSIAAPRATSESDVTFAPRPPVDTAMAMTKPVQSSPA